MNNEIQEMLRREMMPDSKRLQYKTHSITTGYDLAVKLAQSTKIKVDEVVSTARTFSKAMEEDLLACLKEGGKDAPTTPIVS